MARPLRRGCEQAAHLHTFCAEVRTGCHFHKQRGHLSHPHSWCLLTHQSSGSPRLPFLSGNMGGAGGLPGQLDGPWAPAVPWHPLPPHTAPALAGRARMKALLSAGRGMRFSMEDGSQLSSKSQGKLSTFYNFSLRLLVSPGVLAVSYALSPSSA